MLIFVAFLIPGVFAKSRTTFNTRIIGGNEATPHSHPWQASLQYKVNETFRHICGAVVKDENFIITAAHCVYFDPIPSKFRVVVGEHDLTVLEGYEQFITVADIRTHPDYEDYGGFKNDVAVLVLGNSITMVNGVVEAVPLTENVVTSNNNCTISGWGRTNSSTDDLPDTLQEAATKVITHANCWINLGLIGLAYLNSNAHICIYSGGNSACNGDSGGPLICHVNGTKMLAGVTSWGLNGCPPNFATVYARISTYAEWVNGQTMK